MPVGVGGLMRKGKLSRAHVGVLCKAGRQAVMLACFSWCGQEPSTKKAAAASRSKQHVVVGMGNMHNKEKPDSGFDKCKRTRPHKNHASHAMGRQVQRMSAPAVLVLRPVRAGG